MGLFDDLSKTLQPHSDRLNETLANSTALLHSRLGSIEQHVSDLGRPDVGDKWFRIQIRKIIEAEEETINIAHVPINEIWIFESLVVDGIQNKSPAFVIEAGGALISSVIKEGVGSENFGGNAVFLPGEQITITGRKTGVIRASISVVRRPYPVNPQRSQAELIPSSDRITPVNTHDPARDEIVSRTDEYVEPEGEVRGDGRYEAGSPAVDPTAV